jgi:nucleoside-diphosphate-sugar epimerase
MKILITGASGMLGTEIAQEALRSGHDVLLPGHGELDLRNESTTYEYLKLNSPEAIYHCAAKVGGISANIANPSEFLTENIRIDNSVLAAAKSLEIPNLIYMGSSCMYPRNLTHAMKEDEILTGQLEPTNESYALAKLVGWKTVQLNSSNLNWRTVVLSNLYGPRDHFEPNRSHLLAAIIAKIHDAKKNRASEIEMWGDGNSRREFTFAKDVAEFLISSLPGLAKFPATLNVGSGIDYSVLEYYQFVSEIMGYEGVIVPNLQRPTGMVRKLMDVSRATALGWRANTQIRIGIEATSTWYSKIFEGERT